MAHVDFISNNPEQRFTRFPYRTDLVPPQPNMYPFRPALCPRCYNPTPAYGICPTCNPGLHLPPHPLLPPTMPRPPEPTPLQDPGDLNADRFMMSNMLHVVNDVLKEQDEKVEPPPENSPPSAETDVPLELTMPIQIQSTSGSTNSSPKGTQCSVCGEDHVAFCIECQDFLCDDCVVDHEQMALTKDHRIISTPTSSQASSRKTTPPGVSTIIQSPPGEQPPPFDEEECSTCDKHPEEKLAYFCQTCVAVVCNSCSVSDHSHHSCMTLREAYIRFNPTVGELLGKSQVEVNMLDLSFDAAEKMTKSVSKKQQEAVADVYKVFQAHKDALVQREKEVIAQINAIADLRLDSLSKEKEKIESALKSLKSLNSLAEKALSENDKGQILVTHFQLSEKLQNCHMYTFGRNPVEDDSFVIKSNTSAANNTLKNLCMLTTAPYPPLCTAVGEGLFHPRVNRLCTVVLCTKDRAGEPCLEGGERLFVQLKSVSGGGVLLSVDIRDNQDGSYSINFRPRMKGEHQLVIAIRGQHIQGSPFTLLVDGGREYGRFGILTQVFGSEGSQNAQFCRPWGICCDQQGNIIVGDRSNHRVQVFDSNGVFKYKFGSEGVRPGQFNRPAGVAVTREGHIAVADKDNHRIQVLKLDGTFLFMFGSKGGNDGQMIYPYDVAVNQLDGRIAVTDTGNHRLLIFSHEGILLGKFGYKGYLCGHFDSPRGISFNDDGHIIVSDFNVHHILVIHPDGTTARILGSQGSGNGQFMRPQGIAVDHMGNFIIADTRNNRIVIMHPSGHFIAKFGVPGSAPGQFDRPTSIAVMPDGRIAVVDFGNSRIQIF